MTQTEIKTQTETEAETGAGVETEAVTQPANDPDGDKRSDLAKMARPARRQPARESLIDDLDLGGG